MILPIYAYGQPVLKQVAEEIDENYGGLAELLENMWETLYHSDGVGLAAPQIGLPIRIFLVDTQQLKDDNDEPLEGGIKQVFINPIILEENGKPWDYEEGCLSIPDLRADVSRKPKILIEYYDENFNLKEEAYEDIHARVIQHEYDHLEGILFTDHLKPLKKRMMKRKMEKIRKGEIDVDYPMRFVNGKKRR